MGTLAGDATLERLRDQGLSREVRDLELPEAQVVGPAPARRPTRKAMLGRLFYVYGSEARLESPIDWLQDPHGSRSWRYELHTLTWLKEALARHAVGGDVETLAVARDVALDWARAHLRAGEGAERSEFAWYDMAVGLRAPYLAYVLRACLAERTLADDDALLLLEAVERHGAELAAGDNYAAGNNHGLFQDEGLYLLARILPELPAAAAWRELALNRLMSTLRATVSFAEGAHLEHSTAYQFAIVDLVARLAANVGELPELGPLLERMRRVAAWQTTPGGRMAQLGDTDDVPAPQWARDAASALHGMHLLPAAGQAFVRQGNSYLAITAAHHGPAHKHADDTGLLLIEDGKVVLGDAGRWGYYEDEPERRYARSAAAHNVLTLGWNDFPWRQAEPYGGGIQSAAEGEGWYTFGLRNPLLAAQGADHRRVLFYRPGSALVIGDKVRSEEEREYVRRLHFGPELELEQVGGNQISVTGKGIAATLTELTERTEFNLSRGYDAEPLTGWTYPADRERTEVWTVTFRSFGSDVDCMTALNFEGRGPIAGMPETVKRVL